MASYFTYDDLKGMKSVELDGKVLPVEDFIFKIEDYEEEEMQEEATKMVFKAKFGIDERTLDKMFEDEDLKDCMVSYVSGNCEVLFNAIAKELCRKQAQESYDSKRK